MFLSALASSCPWLRPDICTKQRSAQGARSGGKGTIKPGRRDRFGPQRGGKPFVDNPGCRGRVEARDELKSQFAKIRICLGHAEARTPTDRT